MALTGATHAHDGEVDWTFAVDDSLVQYLAKDETVTATYTISVKDNSGDSATDTSTQTVTVTITGTNDTPVITAGDVDGHVTEDVGAHTIDSGSTVYLTDSGAISFTDVDTDDVSTATVALTGTPSTTGPAIPTALSDALATAMALTGATHAHAGEVDWTFAVDDSLVQYLAKDETVTATYTISVKDNSGDSATDTSTQTVTVTITGTNDTPVITAVDVDGHVTEDVGAHTIDSGSTVYLTDSGAISFTDADTDDVSTATVALTGTLSTTGPAIPTALSDALATAMALTGATHAHAGEVDWTFAVDDSLVQYLAAGETVTATYTIAVKDNSGDSATDTSTQTVTVTITGTNDPPVIQQGPEMAGVTEDAANTTVTGQFTAIDPDQDATQAWQVLSGDGLTAGTVTHNADFSFALDSLNIVKNSTNVFSDGFTSAPANGDGRYSVGANNIPGTLTVDTDANNRSVLVLDAAHGVTTNGIGSTTPFLVDSATALTGTNPAGSSTLTKTDDFTVQARFDLTVPNDLNEAYGIRLTDRLPGVTVGGTTGDDVVELRVAENTAGGIQVQFRDINFQTGPLDSNNDPLGTVTTLQTFGLSTGAIQSGEQIVLTLSHAASNPNTIIANYDLYAANGTQLDANGAAAGLTQTFTVNGSLFSDENWTQAQIHASSPSVDNSYYTGTYGTLTVDPTGAWSYSLLNGSTQVQALAAGQVVQDNFEIQVKDDQGATSTQAVTVNVTGTNDAPVAKPDAKGIAEDAGPVTGNLLSNDTDVDLTDIHSVSAVTGGTDNGTSITAVGTYGTLVVNEATGGYTYTLANGQANVQALTAGQTVTDVFTYTDSDNHGGSSSSTLTITVTGANDAPVLDASKSPTFGTINEDQGPPFGAVGVSISSLVDLNPPLGGLDNVTDADSGTTIGLAIVGINTTDGTLWYSADNGTHWVTYGSASDTTAILIPANSLLYYQPAANFNGTVNDAITIRAWDETAGPAGTPYNITANGGTGGTTPFSSATDTVSIIVNPVNDAPVLTSPSYTLIDFQKDANIQTSLIKEFPTVSFTANNSLATPFAITADGSAHNFYDAFSSGSSLTVNVSIANVTNVYALMNGYGPTDGHNIATVEFVGSAGATETFTLVNGQDVRDFFQGGGGYANSINGTTTQNAFIVSGVQDAAGTGNVNTGATGTYAVDEHNFVLNSAFATQTLTQIVFTDLGTGGTPILLGLTAQSVAGTGSTLNYTESDGPGPILPALSVTDINSADFTGGSLTVSFTANGTSADQLTIQNQGTGAGQIGFSGSNVTYGGTTIGTFTGGANGSDLVVTFNSASATPAAAQALADHILYANTSDDPSTAPRTVTFTVNDGGSDTGTATATINVTAVNDAPTIAGDKSFTVTRGGSVVLTTNDLRGADVDSPATDLVFTVTAETNGWVALASAPGTQITTFTEGQLEAGSIVFVEDNANPTPPALPPTSASFSVSLTDGVSGTTPATATVNATVTDAEHDLWGELQYPTIVQGEHLFGVNPQFNSQAGVIVLAYSDTFGYSAAAASHTDTRNVALLDPFFLPSEQPAQTLTDSPDTVQAPARYSFILPNVTANNAEGIYVYKTQANTDGTGDNVINQILVTADSSGNLTAGDPSQIIDTTRIHFQLNDDFPQRWIVGSKLRRGMGSIRYRQSFLQS